VWRELLLQEEQEQHELARIFREESDIAARARNRGILLALLAEERMQEAVGAACSQLGDEIEFESDPPPKPYTALAREFFTALGLDWELIYFGFLLAERGPESEDAGETPLSETEVWQMLGARGSARVVRLGVDWIRRARMDSEQAFPFLLRALGSVPRDRDFPVDSIQPELERRERLPAKTRGEVLAVLASYFDSKQPPQALNEALLQIPDSLAKDLRAPLRKLLAHPNHRIAARALELLASAKLAGPKTTIATPPAPLRFRVILDGEPLRNTAVKVAAEGIEEREVTTDADGRLTISLVDVLQPENIREVRIWIGPGGKEVVSSTLDEEKKDAPGTRHDVWPGSWFVIETPVLAEDATEKEIAANTGEIEIGLKGTEGVPPEALVSVSLTREENDDDDGISFSGWARAAAKPGASVVFQHLQLGKYRVSVDAEGIAKSEAQSVKVTKSGALKMIELKPGRHVQGEILLLNGEKFDISIIGKLSHDGAEVESQGVEGWEGLPLGKYQLEIPSTKELEDAARAEGETLGPFPKEHRHARHEVEIELAANSPPVVDLGTIKLKPEKADAEDEGCRPGAADFR
jgi:hypothetical protein